MKRFRKGELAIVDNASALPHYVGETCIITELDPFCFAAWFCRVPNPDYQVQMLCDGVSAQCWDHNLRKLPPDVDNVAEETREECEA